MASSLNTCAEWLPVSDCLPDEGVRVLLCCGEYVVIGFLSQHPRHFVKGAEPFYGTWCKELSPDEVADEMASYCYPTHWMPLPEIPS